MDTAIQPELTERTVFEAVRRDDFLRQRYESEFASCYECRDADQREQTFALLHLRWFSSMGFRDRIRNLTREFPYIREKIDRLRVILARGHGSQSAELFGVAGRFTLVMAIQPSLLLDEDAFAYRGRHELMHVDDMLNPAFGYDPSQCPAGRTSAERNLIRDRYAVLWAMSIDARLVARGQAPQRVRQEREIEIARVFCPADPQSAARVLARFWDEARWLAVNHGLLMDWARDGIPEICSCSGQPGTPPAASPGQACPLCRFPTYDWLDKEPDLMRLAGWVRTDFPGWNASDPICRRCGEVYSTLASTKAVSA